jgi:LSD1 subclass zinc finger protein
MEFEMRNMTCTKCATRLSVPDGAASIACPVCGTRYKILGQTAPGGTQAQGASLEREAQRGGCVADRPSLERDEFFGKVWYRSWLPEGWTYRVSVQQLERSSSMATPFVPTIIMCSPDESEAIYHTTSNAFVDPAGAINMQPGPVRGPFGMMVPQEMGQVWLDGLTHYPTSCLDPTSGTRYRDLVDVTAYCDEVAALLGISNRMVVADVDGDDWIRKRMAKAIQEMPPDLRECYWYAWHRRIYRAHRDGVACLALVEAQISTNGFNV